MRDVRDPDAERAEADGVLVAAGPPAAEDDDDRTHRPIWLWLTPFLGRPPPLTRRQWRVLGLVAFATLFDQYDRAIFALALPQIQASLAIPESDVGYLGSIVRLGSLPALGVALAADRLGRRRVLLWTIAAYTLLTGATALAPDTQTFITLQFFARIFTTAEVLLAVVVIAEEFDAENRGWGIGALFAIQACGVGVVAILFPLVEWLGWGWRALFAFGLVPLVLIAWWRRGMPETPRFEHQQRQQSEHALAPVRSLVRDYPGRFAGICVVILLFAMGGAAADFLGPKYLQDAHGWTPSNVAFVYVIGGAFGIVGATFAGWLGDRRGRRPVTVLFGLAVIALAAAFYNAAGWVLIPLWVVMIFALIGHDTLLAAFGAEMFPTSYRSTAAGARAVVATVGAVLGLALESVLYAIVGSHWTAVTILLAVAIVAPVVVGLTFPETSRRQLEEIAPERG